MSENNEVPTEEQCKDVKSPELKGFDRTKIRKGLIIFVLLTVCALTVIFLKTHTGSTITAFRNFNFGFMSIVLVLSFFDMSMGALRNHIYFRKLYPGLSFSVSFKANLANIFMGAVTPSQSGGGPAQLYVYYRAGVSVGKSISVSVLNYLATLVFFLVAAGFSLHVLSDSFSKTMHDLIVFCFAVFVVQFIAVLLVVLKPGFVLKIATGFSKRLCKWLPKFESRISRIADKLIAEVTAYKDSCSLFVKKHPLVLLLATLLTCVLYMNKFILAYFIMLGLGLSGHFVEVLCIQALVLFICYFSPSPGASGVAELSIAALMSSVMAENTLGIFTLLQRFFILYIPVILGAIVVLKETGSSMKSQPGKQSA